MHKLWFAEECFASIFGSAIVSWDACQLPLEGVNLALQLPDACALIDHLIDDRPHGDLLCCIGEVQCRLAHLHRACIPTARLVINTSSPRNTL